jgi:hypothetical protein
MSRPVQTLDRSNTDRSLGTADGLNALRSTPVREVAPAAVEQLRRKAIGFIRIAGIVAAHVAMGMTGLVSLLLGLAMCITIVLAPLGLPLFIVGMTLLSMVGQPNRTY